MSAFQIPYYASTAAFYFDSIESFSKETTKEKDGKIKHSSYTVSYIFLFGP